MNEIGPAGGRRAQSRHIYRIFDLSLSSSLPLAGLPEVMVPAADWAFDLRRGALADEGWEWLHDWLDSAGTLQVSCARRGSSYRLRFPGTADFRVDVAGALIEATAPPTTAESTLVQLLLDQVLPRVLFHTGRLVVHASAAGLGPGRAVAFVGPSGRGKSTLAAAYWRAGAPVLTDDCLLLQPAGGGFEAVPAYPSLRLWPDSVAALELDALRVATIALESGKQRLILGQAAAGPHSMPLDALFMLGDPLSAPVDDVEIQPLRGQQAMMSLIESAFVLDLVSKECVRRNFALVGTVAQAGVPMYALNYPRRFDALPRVRESVAAAAAAMTDVWAPSPAS